MAEIIAGHVFRENRGRPCVYPYGEWFDGKQRRLRRGADFAKPARTVSNSCAHHARKLGIAIRVDIEDENTMVLQAVLKDPA